MDNRQSPTRFYLQITPCAFVLFYHPRFASRPPLRFSSLKICLIRTAQSATRRNTAHITDNPTIGAPRFPETCFTSVHVYHHKSKHRIRIEPSPYLRKNFRVIIVCNLEAVSVIETKGGARLGTHSLHDRTSALRGIPGLCRKIDNSLDWLRVLFWKNVPRRCPSQRTLKIEVINCDRMLGWNILPTSIAAQLHHQRGIGFWSKQDSSKTAVEKHRINWSYEETGVFFSCAPGVAMPPAAKLTTGRCFKRAVSLSKWNGAWISLAYA